MPEQGACSVAIVGAGYTAREHARAFRDIASVRLTGIFSRTRARAEALAGEFGIEAVCESIDELYERSRADLVVLTVVELAMGGVSRQCFRYPWAVLMEKPPGYNMEDALAIQTAARAGKRRVYVALNRRMMSATLGVQGQLASSHGRRFIKVQDQQSQAKARELGQPEQVVANWMFANSIHVIDYFHVLGRGTVTAVEPVLPWDPADPAVVVTKLTFASGDVGLYEGIWNGPGPWAVSVTVPSRRWELRPLEQATTQALGNAVETIPVRDWDTKFKPGFRLQAEAVLAAALDRAAEEQLPAPATLDDAVETMRLIDRIFHPTKAL
jgi:predicted dehydrogenase